MWDWLPGFFSAVRACLRVVLLAATVAYLAFIHATYRVPVSPRLDPFVESGAWLVAMAVIAETVGEMLVFGQQEARILRGTWSRLRGRWGLAAYGALMVAALVPAGTASWSAGLSIPNCAKHDAMDCLKLDNWAESHGEYLRQYPYDAQGNSDPGAAWQPISRADYIAEYGTYARYDALFDVLCLGAALAMTVLEEGIVSASRPSHGSTG